MGAGTRVPFSQHVQRLLVVECKSSHEPTADPKRLDVAVLTGNCGWHRGQVPLRSVNDRELEVPRLPRPHRLRPWIRVLDRWKICRPVQTARIAVLIVTRCGWARLWLKNPGNRVFCVTGVAAGSVCNSRASCFCNRSTASGSKPLTRQNTWM